MRHALLAVLACRPSPSPLSRPLAACICAAPWGKGHSCAVHPAMHNCRPDFASTGAGVGVIAITVQNAPPPLRPVAPEQLVGWCSRAEWHIDFVSEPPA
eukprot:2809192-Alexandrium_andersonii.AAC.1